MKGVGVLRFLEFYHKMALHGKNCKIHKNSKNLKSTPFHVLPLSCRRLLPLSRRGEKKRPMEK
jgi:hypothetical protein